MKSLLEKLREERDQAVTDATALMDSDGFDPEDKDYSELKTRAEGLDKKIAGLVSWESSRQAADKVDALALKNKKLVEERGGDEPLTPGEIFVRSPQYLDYLQAPRGTSGRVEISSARFHTRAPILTTTYPGVIDPDRIGPIAAPDNQTPLLDAMSRVRVGTNSVEWVSYPSSGVTGAAVVAEGAVKPEGGLVAAVNTVTLENVAVWVQVSRAFLEDSGAARDWINASLTRGVTDKHESNAAGVISGDTNIPTGPGTGSLLEEIRVGIGLVQSAGFQPDIVLLNPGDYAALDIDVLGRTLLGPQVGTSFWGVRPIAVGALAAGTAYVADASAAFTFLERNTVSVYVSDSHASTFVSNVLTILAEQRGKTVVTRPEAAAKVTGTVLAGTASTGGGGGGRK